MTPPLDDELRSLSRFATPDATGELDARVRRLAHAELAASTASSWTTLATRAVRGLALPAAIAVTAVGYLRWAIEAVNALHH